MRSSTKKNYDTHKNIATIPMMHCDSISCREANGDKRILNLHTERLWNTQVAKNIVHCWHRNWLTDQNNRAFFFILFIGAV